MLRQLRSDLFRMRRRWMPLIMLGLIVIAPFVIYFLIWASVNAQLQAIKAGTIPPPAGGTAPLEQTLRQLTPEVADRFGVALVVGFGTFMLIVFAASHVGTEFGWGTLRTLLAHGASRGGFIGAKAVSLVLYDAAFVVVGTIAAIAASYAVSAVAGLSTQGPDIGAVAQAAAKGGYSFLPYMALSAAVAVMARSAGAGIATGLVVNFTEGIVASILVSINKDYAQIVNWGISRNVSALTNQNTSTAPSALSLPDQTTAAVVLAVYTAVFFAFAYWRLRTRDVTAG